MGIADFNQKPEAFDLGDIWFYDPEGVQEWARDYYLSNYDTGHLPRPGVGMRHQHKTVRHDWFMWKRGLAWTQGQLQERKELEDMARETMLGSGF